MRPHEFLQAMKTLLADERNALRRLDVKAVTEAGARKEELLKAVMNPPESERAGLLAALKEVRGDLRRNLVLLAHARDYLRDALALCTENNPAARPRLRASL